MGVSGFLKKCVSGAVALATFAIISSAQATPLRLDYIVTDLGGSYQYDFTMTLDNNDGSFVAGQEFDWFIIGDTPTPDGLFPEKTSFFTDIPSGFKISWTYGGHHGPTLGFYGESSPGYGVVFLPGWAPALGDSFEFTGVSTLLVAEGELLWSNSVGSNRDALAIFEVANQIHVSAVPLPAALPLYGAGLALAGFLGWRKKHAIAA